MHKPEAEEFNHGSLLEGYLRLALVSCPIALHAACSTAERIAFRQINKATGNRLRQQLIDSAAALAAARLALAPWPICSRTASTSERWCTAGKSIAATIPRSSVPICSRPCRESSRRKPSNGAAACAAHPLP